MEAPRSATTERIEVAEPGGRTSRLMCDLCAAVAAASVSWTPMKPEFFGEWVGSSMQVWPRVESATVLTSSDAEGRFELPPATPDLNAWPGALWVTHPEHAPALVQLAAGGTSLPPLVQVQHVDRITVRVRDGEGRPVQGAHVSQWAPVPRNQLADLLEPQALRVLRRSFESAADGTLEAHGWRGSLAVSASASGLGSEVWVGEPRRLVDLVLHSTFVAAGRVAFTGPLQGGPRVVCSAIVGKQSHELAVVPVHDGDFGPVELPLVPCEGYAFRLEGWDTEVRVARVDPPRSGERVFVELEARAGLDVWLIVEEAGQVPIEGAEVTVTWQQADGLRVEASAHSGEDGYAGVRGVPPGTVQASARAAGYAVHTSGPYPVPPAQPEAIVLTMAAGREIAGTVLHADEPVEDFELSWWDFAPADVSIERFRARERGDFSVQVPADRSTTLVATAEGLGSSAPVAVGPEETMPLRLELEPLLRGRGVVVSAKDSAPLPDAYFETFVPGGSIPAASIGSVRRVGADGRFDAASFPSGRSATRFSAPGHGVHWIDTVGTPGEVLELGSVALPARQDLTLRITSDRPFDASRYQLRGSGAEVVPRRDFPSDGVLRVEDLSPGSYYFEIRGPKAVDYWAHLEPGAEWDLEVPVEGERVLEVRVDAGEDPARDLLVRAHLPGPPGADQRTIQQIVRVPVDGVVELTGLSPGTFSLFLVDPSGSELATTHGELSASEPLTVVQLGPPVPPRTLVVSTSDGEPLAGGDVMLWDPATGLVGRTELDDRGRGLLRGLPPERTYVARIVHPTLGSHFGIPVELPRDRTDPIRLTFVSGLSLDIRLLDGTRPLAGVQCQLLDEREGYDVSTVTTDEHGRAWWKALGPGRYAVRVRSTDVWPRTVLLESSEGEVVEEVQARRVGGLRLETRSASGVKLAGKAFELASIDLEESVGAWLADQRVSSSTGELRTDAAGELELEGLPHGTYGWSFAGAAGQVVVRAGEAARVVLTAP